uniref:Saposin B-type domain-containing protein n=1 Tax=Steinernema glaseri TaxID=37863 RepID=A0A1I8AH11_9BILA
MVIDNMLGNHLPLIVRFLARATVHSESPSEAQRSAIPPCASPHSSRSACGMKAIILLLVLVASASAFKTQLLNKNRTPKESFQTYVAKYGSACDECQLLVKRFEEAAKDPAKMATLKGLLSLLCHETSYEEECKVIVSRLDLIIERLLPYLKDPLTICRKFHMCGNSRLEQFRKIAMLYAQKYVSQEDFENDLVCEECQFAANELRSLIDQKQTQDDIRHFLSNNICAHLGRYRGSCDIVVEQFLPEFFQELHHVLENQKEFCADLGLCKHALPSTFPLKAADKKVSSKFLELLK